MELLQDIRIDLDAEKLTRELLHGRSRPTLVEAASEAITMGIELVRPAAVYDWFDLAAYEDTAVTVSGNGLRARFEIGSKSFLLKQSRTVLVGVLTIGKAIEERIADLRQSGLDLESFMLDSVGVVALGEVGQAVRRVAEERAEKQGWGVSPSLSPGSLADWPLSGQADICSLLDIKAIDVDISDSFLLRPFKSVTSVIGLGPEFKSTMVGSVCKYCQLQKSCWRRKKDVDE